jgi:molecular chaperone DnaK
VAGDSPSDIQSKTAALAQATARLEAAAGQGAQGQGAPSGQNAGDDDVVDAEFEEVDDGQGKS